MRRFCVVLLALAGLTISAPAVQAACPGVAFFAIGGTGDPKSVRVPGVYGWVHRVGYPAQVERGDYSREVARRNLDREARAMRARCPGTHISVRAVSLGASAASLATDRWIGTYLANNTDAVFYGDPRAPRVGRFSGIEAAGLPNIPGVYTFRGARRTAWWISTVCHRGRDIICWAPRPIHSDLNAAYAGLQGYLGSGHWY